MKPSSGQKAVAYLRVSGVKQTTRGDGLNSQLTRCREYATMRGYEVVEVFQDDLSGSLIKRPGMQAMLAFLARHRKHRHVVLIDDISRLARGVLAHWELRDAIEKAGGILESPSIEFGDSSDSQLIENLLASVSQHQRQKNGEQTKNRMRGRALNGFWCHFPPVGYRYERSSQGKIMVPHEPIASLVREALEGFACERFGSQAEVKRFLEAQALYPKDRRGLITNQRVKNLLTQPLYAGFIEMPKWDISLRPAKHEGLISFETYKRIQDRLEGRPRVPARTDISHDFPLRGFVLCGDCTRPLTANWSKGQYNSFPYYLCRNKGCESEGKSIRRETVEGQFEALLKSLTPSAELFSLSEAIFRDLWDQRIEASSAQRKHMAAEISQIERKIEQLIERLLSADSDTVIRVYESQIGKLEAEKHVLNEKIAKCGRPLATYEDSFRTAMGFLSNPWNLWTSDRMEDKRTVLKLAFSGNLAYCRKEGFRTAEISLPFKALQDFSGVKIEMAHPKGFEPLTPRFLVCETWAWFDASSLALPIKWHPAKTGHSRPVPIKSAGWVLAGEI